MKTFPQFIFEAYYYSHLLLEGRGDPDYNYEESFVRIYNYLTGSENIKNKIGRQMRSLIQRSAGDSAEAADVMNDIISLIAKEVGNAETDPNHPLHFENAPDSGFTGKAGRTEEHRDAYYEKLNNQKYTFLNFIGTESGRSIAASGYPAGRAGNEKIPLTTRGAEVYGKSSDTSRADVVFKDRITGEIRHTSSLKDVQGSVGASSGPEETKGNLLMGMDAVLNSRLKNREINQNEYDELKKRGETLASEIALKLTTKGLSKEEESGIINPEIDSRGLFRTMAEFEDSFPGVSDYVSKEQITGKGKYGKGVDSVLKTGRGGELIEFPEFLAAFVKQRPRTSKHGEKGNAAVAADNLPVPNDVDRPEADAESMYNITASRSQIERKKQGDKIIADLQSGKSKTLDQFQQDAQAATAPAPIDPKAEAQQAAEAEAQQAAEAEAQQAAAEAQAELTQAEKAKERAEKIIGPGGKRVLRQHVGSFLANNPDKAQQRSLKISAAQQNIDASTANINSIQQQKADAQAATTPETPETTKLKTLGQFNQDAQTTAVTTPATPEQVPPEQQQQQAPPQEQVPPPEQQQVQPEEKPKKKRKVEPENVEQTTEPVA